MNTIARIARQGKAAAWISAGVLSLSLGTICPAQAQETLELTAGIHVIQAEVANTGESRAKGLMHRKSMPRNHGMLFVFERSSVHCMWMRNTLMPLSVAFLDDQGHILNIEEMRPQTDDSHCASRPARFALEMGASWFADKGLGTGAVLKGIDKAPAAH